MDTSIRSNPHATNAGQTAIAAAGSDGAGGRFDRALSWLISSGVRERPVKDAAEKLQMSMRTTAKCRYNASIRLQHQAKYSFFTTTLLSLGLIFIPLMQNAGMPIAYRPNVLNMMSIFLAVAVLVYSVVIGTARYDVRATQLTECGDK